VGEGEELLGEEFVFLGEGDEVVAEDEEVGQELGLAGGELGEFRREWSSGDHERDNTTRRGECKGVWG
jgi:hypothetical protein